MTHNPTTDRTAQPEQDKPTKWYAVEYSGFWNIQNGPNYEDVNVLDADRIGERKAKINAAYICEACNNYPALKQQNERLIEALKGLTDEVARKCSISSEPGLYDLYRRHQEALAAIETSK